MRKTINVGEKTLEIEVNAATPYLYRKVFNKDLLRIMTSGKADEADTIDVGTMLMFIGSNQAKELPFSQLITLSEEDFYQWLTEFNTMDIAVKCEEVLTLWLQNTKTSSKPKKENGQQ